MSYIHLSDCHNHSNISLDGTDPAEAMLKRAESLGLYYYTLTDHCECNTYIEEDYKHVALKAYDEMCRLGREYSGQLRVTFLKGIELGQPMQDLSAAADALKGRDYDVVLGSLHNLSSCKDFYFWDQLNLDVDYALDRYFIELEEMVEWGRFDTLTHITYPLRYIVGDNGIYVDYSKYMERTEHIFKMLIDKGIALEINTSGLRQKIGETMPNARLIQLYKSLGGELITIGSDAHSCRDLGKGIEEGMDILKSAGFKAFTVFIKRKPVMVDLI